MVSTTRLIYSETALLHGDVEISAEAEETMVPEDTIEDVAEVAEAEEEVDFSEKTPLQMPLVDIGKDLRHFHPRKQNDLDFPSMNPITHLNVLVSLWLKRWQNKGEI